MLKPRILLIEDDPGRTAVIEAWLGSTEFALVAVRSGGQALGMLQKGSTQAVAGILLDHDLSNSPITENDLYVSATQLLPLIKRHVRRTVPILIHSHSVSQPLKMQRTLEAGGFSVERIRFEHLTPERFANWLDQVRDCWDADEEV